MRYNKLKSSIKFNDRKSTVDMKIFIPDITTDISISTEHHIQLAIIRHDVLNIVLGIFYDMAKMGEHITDIKHEYVEAIDEYRVSFTFEKFHETVVVMWDARVSLLKICSYGERREPVGDIIIIIQEYNPPLIEHTVKEPTTLMTIISKHLERNLSQYRPKEVLK